MERPITAYVIRNGVHESMELAKETTVLVIDLDEFLKNRGLKLVPLPETTEEKKMSYKVPLVYYNASGSRIVIGSAEIEEHDGELSMTGELSEEYSHLLQPEFYKGEFSFTPTPAEAAFVDIRRKNLEAFQEELDHPGIVRGGQDA